MKEIAIQNEKAIVAGIFKALNKFDSHKKGIVYAAIEVGEKLIEAKNLVPYGQWENWLNRNSELRFGTTNQASKFIKIAKNKIFVLEFLADESSINNLTKAISDASPEQLEKVEQLKAEAEQKRLADEQAKAEKAMEAAKKDIDAIDAEFVEVKEPATTPKPEPKKEEVKTGFVQIESEKLEEIEDNMHELASLNNSISKDNASMVRVFDSNDQLSAAAKEIKRLNELNTSLEGRLNGFMNERNALIKEAKYWRARFEKLEKSVVANG